MIQILFIFYILGLACIFIYSLVQFHLTTTFRKNSNQKLPTTDFNGELPTVTIQLPVFNEKYVVERLISNIVLQEYPQEKLEIQVLDDSTDQTRKIVEELVSNYRKKGVNIRHIHRTDRTGFKAGALKNGLRTARGEFIAIFDADFLPEKNWLKNTIIHFHHPSVGMVQTRWEHLNSNHSLLTAIQAFALDYHFTIEQNGRYFGNHFLSFNGTAGIWRKKTILDAGNWKSDTITEDLDLSYRAQMRGWKFKYVEAVSAPAELPVSLSAVKSQQFRWNKGAAENFRSVFRKVWQSDKRMSTKIHAAFHLLNSSMYLPILSIAVFSIPLFFLRKQIPNYELYIVISATFGISNLLYVYCFWVAYKRRKKGGLFSFLGKYFLFLFGTAGLLFHNSRAVLQGFFGISTDFIRTPKFNSLGKLSNVHTNNYARPGFHSVLEGLFALVFGLLIYFSVLENNYAFVFLYLLFFTGFTLIVLQSLTEN